MATYKLLIDGELVDGESTFAVTNPSTLEEVGKCPHAAQDQVEAAVQAAKAAQPAWAAMPLRERKAIMRKVAKVLEDNIDTLGELLVKEQGKPLMMAGKTGEMGWSINKIKEVTKETDLKPTTVNETTKVFRRPIGVIAGLTPWNFPVYTTVQKWVPALLYGNTFVHKPSPYTPLTGLKIGELLKDVFPKGVFNVVVGDDTKPFNVGGFLSQHADVHMVSFTGSVPTGKKVMENSATNGMRRYNIEAGGNDAAVVLPDCDPKEVAPGLFQGAMFNTGQVCVAIKRCYVHESIYDDVVEELVKCAKDAKFGDGFKEGVMFGPLNNKMQFDKVMGVIEDTKKVDGAKFECGGKKMEGDDLKGYFIEPTIVSGVKEGCRLVDDEQFGPVLPVIKYSEVDDALKRANDSKYGLGGSVWSKDQKKATSLALKIQAGTVWVNSHTPLTGGPFGGFKESGIGREAGMADISTFTEMQTIYVESKAKAKAEGKAKAKAAPKDTEKKVDPDDGQAYTFSELSAYYAGKYKKTEVRAYWDETCKAKKSGKGGRRGR